MNKKTIGFYTATSVVIANMVGTGVFTSLGYQVLDIKNGSSIVLLWIIGGIVSLLGALCYAEIGTTFPRSGGEYNYLSKIYHPAVGFMSGFVSSTVAFSAPVAAAALALGTYFNNVFAVDPKITACIVVIALSFVHAFTLNWGSKIQTSFTIIKVLLIIVFIVFGLFSGHTGDVSFALHSSTLGDVTTAAFAIALFYVSYSYSGWNAASYIAGEIENPQRNLPKSLLYGTAIVTVLYVLLNYVFLYTAPIGELAGKADVGAVSANFIFGVTGGKIISIVISILLVSSVSSMVMAGPRVSQTMGNDLKFLSFLGKTTKNNTPLNATFFQCIISLFFIFTATFSQVITYIGFTLLMFTFLTVFGLFVIRTRKMSVEGAFKTPLYPLTPILFLIFNTWLLYFGFTQKPVESLIGLGTVLLGLVVYFIGRKGNQKDNKTLI
jgi:basic amino acid/polyamine antiporter, APA family